MRHVSDTSCERSVRARTRAVRRRPHVAGAVAAAVATAGLVLSGSTLAKVGIAIAAGEARPSVGERVALTVRSERPLGFDLRLVAVAPGQPVFRVVATITGDTGSPLPNVARHGFEIPLTRVGPGQWRGTARFLRPGRWRVVVPNGAPVGVIVPNGAALLALTVRR